MSGEGAFGYQGKGYTIACTAGGVYAAQLAGNRETEWVLAALNSLENEPKMFSRKDNGHFYYSHYYAMQAMVQAGEERYAKWYPKIRDSLITLQQPNGSWQEKEQDYPAQDAYGDHHPWDPEPVYPGLSTLKREYIR